MSEFRRPLKGSHTRKYGDQDDTESDEDQFLIVDVGEPDKVPPLPSKSPSPPKKRKPLQPHELLPDEECVKLVAESIKKIIRQSTNEDFRQECFKLMNIRSSDGVEPVLREKLRSTIGLTQPVPESSNPLSSQSLPIESIPRETVRIATRPPQAVADSSSSPSQSMLIAPMLREKLRITAEYSQTQTGQDSSCSLSQPMIIDPILREKFRLGVSAGFTQLSSDLSSSQSLFLSQQLVSETLIPRERSKEDLLRKMEARRPSRQSKESAARDIEANSTSTQ